MPDKMLVGGPKEQVLGNFQEKFSEAGCCLKQTEPYYPWKNAVEGFIWELKCGVGRKMTKLGSPKRLWGHCLELEGIIRLCMVLDIYKFSGEVPKTVITGDTADIITIVSNVWYNWIKFYDPVGNSFPEHKYYLGRYLGPEIGIGPALTAKILKINGEVVQQSTYRSLTAKELNDEEDLRPDFDQKIEDKIRPKATVNGFDDMNMEETPTFEMYGDNNGFKGTPD